MLVHQVDFLMHRLRGLNNKGYRYCEIAVKEAPSYKDVIGKTTNLLLISFCTSSVLYGILPAAIFLSLTFSSDWIESLFFTMCIIPLLSLTFFHLAKWGAWLSFVEEVNTQSYRFRKIKKAAANSRNSFLLNGLITCISATVCMLVHQLVENGEVYILVALLSAYIICSYLSGLASIRTAFMIMASEDICRYKEDYEG